MSGSSIWAAWKRVVPILLILFLGTALMVFQVQRKKRHGDTEGYGEKRPPYALSEDVYEAPVSGSHHESNIVLVAEKSTSVIQASKSPPTVYPLTGDDGRGSMRRHMLTLFERREREQGEDVWLLSLETHPDGIPIACELLSQGQHVTLAFCWLLFYHAALTETQLELVCSAMEKHKLGGGAEALISRGGRWAKRLHNYIKSTRDPDAVSIVLDLVPLMQGATLFEELGLYRTALEIQKQDGLKPSTQKSVDALTSKAELEFLLPTSKERAEKAVEMFSQLIDTPGAVAKEDVKWLEDAIYTNIVPLSPATRRALAQRIGDLLSYETGLKNRKDITESLTNLVRDVPGDQ